MNVREFHDKVNFYLWESRNACIVSWWYSVFDSCGKRAVLTEIRQFIRNRAFCLGVKLNEGQIYRMARVVKHDWVY